MKNLEKRRKTLLDNLTTGFISGGIMLFATFMGDSFHYYYNFRYWYVVPVIVAFGFFYSLRYLIKTIK